ncbi:MAG TPA: CHAT domain-containing protein [Syntrophales bacterium]|nr:CHAT domain-containing protein [Syntrophales bacterium]
MRKIATGVLWLLVVVMLCGCGALGRDIEVSSLMQKKKHHEAIRMLQGELDAKMEVSSFRLYLLSAAYYEVRDYERLLTTVDLMERRIAGGDAEIYGANLAPYPGIMRGFAYLDQGDFEKAVKAASEAHAVLERIGSRSNGFYTSQLIDINGILGVAQANLNRFAEADRCLDVLKRKEMGQGILGPEQHIAIARVYMAKRQYREALAAIQDPAAKAFGPATVFYDQTFQELPKFFILTKCLYETGRIREAGEGYDQLLRHPQIKQVGGLYWPVLLDRAKIARAGGQDREAEAMLREAVEVIEKQRSSIRSEAGRIGYVGDKQAVYQELVTLLVAGNRPAEAFEYVERAKGRALVDLLASQDIRPRTGSAEQVGTSYRELARAERDLGVVADPAGGNDTARTRGIAVSLKKDLASQAPEFTSLVAVTGTPLGEIRDRLARDEALVEYYEAGGEWFVFVLKRDGIAVKGLGKPDLEKDVRDFRSALTNPASRDYLARSQNLYRKLIQPVSGLLEGSRLTVVPHGPLHYLPFSALHSGREYLVDRAGIRILQTAGILRFIRSRPRAARPVVLVMGNPDLGDPKYDLKYAQEEARAIARLMPGATLLLRERAKASVLTGRAGQFDMIHFAAHGVFDPDDPLGSALLLAGDDAGSGWLRARDLYNLNLNADLVTLSACETALGKITKGDDVVGFTRGFLYAGAGSIVSTLWKVDDRATKDLMLDFYGRILKTDKGEALRQAQRNAMKRHPHPFYWASFQLTGNSQ